MGKMQGSAAFSGTVFRVFITFLLALAPLGARAGSWAFFDFDETLVRCREGGLFKTPVTLFPVEGRNNVLITGPTNPLQLEVSCSDFDAMRRYLAPTPTQVGAIEGTFKLETGEEVVPGFYYFDSYRSFFPHYGEHRKNGNYLREAYRSAMTAVKASSDPAKATESLFGDAWPIARVLLSKAESAKNVGITTARGHSPDREWSEFWEDMTKDGHVQFSPNLALIWGVTRPEFDRYDRDPGNIAARKVAKWIEFAKALRRVKLTDQDEKLNLDGTGKGRYHTLLIAEDNQATLKKVIGEMARLVQSRFVNLKVILINVGTEIEVANAAAGGVPRYAVINSTGLMREATPHEIFGETPNITPEEAKDLMKLLPKQVSSTCISALKRNNLARDKK